MMQQIPDNYDIWSHYDNEREKRWALFLAQQERKCEPEEWILDGEEVLDIIEQEYGCKMEELDESELLDVLKKYKGIEAEEANYDNYLISIKYYIAAPY